MKGSNMKIRSADQRDLPVLAALKQRCWEETYRGIYPDEKIDTYNKSEHAARFQLLIENPERHLIIAEVDGHAAGYLEYGLPLRPFRSFQREIGLLYLLREFQHRGYGGQMFRFGQAAIWDEGNTEFFVSCNKYNTPALNFYRRMGGCIIHTDPDQADRSIPQVKFLYTCI